MKFPPTPPDPEKARETNYDHFDGVSLDDINKKWWFEKDGKRFWYDFKTSTWVELSKRKLENDGVEETNDSSEKVDDEVKENIDNIKRLKQEKRQKLKEEITRLKNQGKETENTGVFISNLPSDVTVDDLKESFCKFGVISEDFKTGKPRIKLYHDDDGFKNEALVIYHNKESVTLAIEMMDDTPLKVGTPNIRVQVAQFENKPKKELTGEEKRLLEKNKDEVRQKLETWDNEEDQLLKVKRKIYDKIVVIHNMFRVEELQKDPALELDLEEDIQEECSKNGIEDITKITVYDQSKVVTVKFKSPSLSEKCIKVFNGRFFDGLKLEVVLYNGEKLEKSN